MKCLAKPILAALTCGCLSAIGASSGLPSALNTRGLAEAPVCFEENRGQVDGPARFITRNRDCAVLIAPTEATLMIVKDDSATRSVRVSFAGANPNATVSGLEPFSGRANYLLGGDSAQWRGGVRLFSRVQLDGIYPGVQLIYYPSKTARLEYDFVLQAGVDPKQIALEFSGADAVRVDRSGDLILKIGRDEVRQPKPFTYQLVNGSRKEIASSWRLINKTTATFSLGEYDHTLPLVIDPTLAFSTLLGGRYGENGWDITTDASGNVYICGDTFSPDLRTNFVATPFLDYPNGRIGGTNSGTRGTHQYGDAFVAKFIPTASNTLQLAYLTYLGGKGQEAALGVAADSDGNAYVTGFTDSPDFPVTTNAAFPRIAGTNQTASHIFRVDAFVSKIDPTGSNLVYSTYLGGSERDSANAIAVDSVGYAYVAGFTQSTNFPVGTNLTSAITDFIKAATNSNVLRRRFGGVQDAFVTKVDTDGSKLVYSTFLGGTNQESATSIKVDEAGAAYVTGYTLSTNFPTVPTNNTYLNNITNRQSTFSFDGFFSKISPDGTALQYSQFLGGERTDVPLRLALTSSNDVFITGYTYSTNFPTTGAITNTRAWTNWRTNAAPDIFVTRLTESNSFPYTYSTNPPGYSVIFGGGNSDQATGLAVDATGNAVIVGLTTSTNLFGPATQRVLVGTNYVTVTNSIQFDVYFLTNQSFTAINSISNTNKFRRSRIMNYAFVAELNSSGSDFLYKAYLGGLRNDVAHGVAVDPLGNNAYIVGSTSSTNYPASFPIETRPGGKKNTNDVFITTISLPPVP
jgi:hypothetical protein